MLFKNNKKRNKHANIWMYFKSTDETSRHRRVHIPFTYSSRTTVLNCTDKKENIVSWAGEMGLNRAIGTFWRIKHVVYHDWDCGCHMIVYMYQNSSNWSLKISEF